MLSHPITRTTVIPLILRLTLAAIFLYHGISKITEPGNDWGMAWAANMLQKEAKPSAVMDKLQKTSDRLKQEGDALKQEGDQLPAGAEKVENAERQKENAKKQEEVVQAIERVKAAYAQAVAVPEALSFWGVQPAVAWGELLAGIALLLGVLTRAAAVGVIVIMIGAIWTVTGAKGFAAASGSGYEYNLAIVAMCLVLFIKGAGPLSIDGLLESRRKPVHRHEQQPVGV
jgi:uncharacterized membrane protein YphA (DoxX/SURF4 family)